MSFRTCVSFAIFGMIIFTMNQAEATRWQSKYEHMNRIISYYERQLDVLDDMLLEVGDRFVNHADHAEEEERSRFQQAFVDWKKTLYGLKNTLNRNAYLLRKDLVENKGKLLDTLNHDNVALIEHVGMMEQEWRGLTTSFKSFVKNLE